MKFTKTHFYWLAFLLLGIIATLTEARGGRGRGGGSFGGLFGGWRKYKKPSSSGNGRRVLSGSPMHTAMTSPSVSMSSGTSMKAAASKPITQTKQKPSYPKQQMPAGYNPAAYNPTNYAGYPAAGGGASYNVAQQPTFYPNAAAIPNGAVFYAQQPMRTGHGDFLMGMLAGHLMNNMLFRPRHHHIYQQEQILQSNDNNNQVTTVPRQVIVINRGGGGEEEVQQQEIDTSESKDDISSSQTSNEPPHFWPMETDVPLAALNDSLLSSEEEEMDTSGNGAIFQRTTNTPTPDTPLIAPEPAPGSIVCFPLIMNETDPNNAELMHEIEKVVCIRVPSQTPELNCITRSYTEPDPADATKTIEVQRQECLPASTTTTEPPIVAGDIGAGGAEDSAKNKDLEKPGTDVSDLNF